MRKQSRHVYVVLWLALLWAATWVTSAGAVEVWVNTRSGVYHCPGGQYYGATQRGRFMPEREAVEHGYRANHGRPCSPSEANAARRDVLQRLAPAVPDRSTAARVWINTGSHVYHCPGTRYYGATQRGRYATEAEAIATGNRPAYGARCR